MITGIGIKQFAAGRRRRRHGRNRGRPESGRVLPEAREAQARRPEGERHDANDKIALRLEAGEPGILQADFGDDGSADFHFKRERVNSIVVDARNGDDLVRIDDANGAFTDSIPTTLDGEDGNDNLAGGAVASDCSAATAAIPSTGTEATTWRSWAPTTTPSSGIPATAATPSKARRIDTMPFNGANAARAHRRLGHRPAAPLLPRRRQHHHGHERRRDGRLPRPRRNRRRSPSTTSPAPTSGT